MTYPLEKSALAALYFPRLAPHQASNRLRRWIKYCEPLTRELLANGYKPSQRILTPHQVRIIFRHLGEP